PGPAAPAGAAAAPSPAAGRVRRGEPLAATDVAARRRDAGAPKRPQAPTARARAAGDLDELVAWCSETPDVMAFQEALRHVGADRWPSVRLRLAVALGEVEPGPDDAPPGYAADRDRRRRGAPRL